MKAKLSTRLIVWVGGPAAVLFAVVVWSASRRSFDRVAAQTETAAQFMAKTHAREVDVRLSAACKIPEMIGVRRFSWPYQNVAQSDLVKRPADGANDGLGERQTLRPN